MLKNKSLFLKLILVVFVLLLMSANVFSYSTKKVDSNYKYREEALNNRSKGVVNLEIEDVSILFNKYSQCEVTIKLNKDIYSELSKRRRDNLPYFMMSIPLKNKTSYPQKMNSFIKGGKYEDFSSNSYFIKMSEILDTYRFKLPPNVAKSFCKDRETGAMFDIYAFVPTNSPLYFGLKNNIYYYYYFNIKEYQILKNKSGISNIDLFESSNLYKLGDDIYEKGVYITYFYNADYAYGVPLIKEDTTPCKLLNDEYGYVGYNFVPFYDRGLFANKFYAGYHYTGRTYKDEYYTGDNYVCVACSLKNPQKQFLVINPFNAAVLDFINWDDLKENTKYSKALMQLKEISGCFDNKKATSIPTASTNLSCDKCPGYIKSKYYPKRTFQGKKYNPGSLCYRCNDDEVTATACDPATGNILYYDAKLTKTLKNEICPEIEINVSLPDISAEIERKWEKLVASIDIPTLKIDLEKDLEEAQIKSKELMDKIIKPITSDLFDCSSQKTPLSERLKLKYNSDNAKYRTSIEDITLIHNNNILEIKVSDSFLKNKFNFLQTGDYATSCLVVSIDLPELQEENRYIQQGDPGTIVNGDIISTINVISKDRLELCINRPVTTLNESDRIIQNIYQNKKGVNKIYTIKQKRKWWFDKKISEFTITLNANLAPLGCIDKDDVIATEAPAIVPEFVSLTEAPSGTCYNPHGTKITGLTGKDNYKKYGFDRLYLNYEKDNLSHNIFDYGEAYPDQDQLKYILYLKSKLLEGGKTTTFNGITFAKSENNTIEPNDTVFFDTKLLNVPDIYSQELNIVPSEFTYTSDPEANFNNIISTVNNIPEELSKFVILDAILSDKQDVVLQKALTDKEIEAIVKKMSGNSYISYSPQKEEIDTANYYGYQISLYSLLKNQEQFRQYLKSKPNNNNFKINNIVFLKQIMENMEIYYGDSVTPVLINTKTYGSLDGGVTQEILESVSFMSDTPDKQIKLATDSKIKEIDAPGLYLFELELDGKFVKYKVSDTNIQTKKLLDYYNMPINVAYKKNGLFTNPINTMYYDYANVPFRLQDGKYREIKNATVYKDFSDWSKIQDGYVLSFKYDDKKLDDIVFKDIRPIQINAPSGYSYKYLTKDGSYSNLANKANTTKDTLFVFLENTAKEPQLVLTSSSPLAFNLPIFSTKSDDGTYVYNIPNSVKSDDLQDRSENYDLYSGIETNNLGLTIDLVTVDRTCFNITDDSINFWLNPEYTKKE